LLLFHPVTKLKPHSHCSQQPSGHTLV